MKIRKVGNLSDVTHETTCEECKTTFFFELYDIRYRNTAVEQFYYIDCPVCDIAVKFDANADEA